MSRHERRAMIDRGHHELSVISQCELLDIRALRGAVIARKVSHCSKNVGGADAFSAFTSVIRTLARNGGAHSLANGLCGAPVPTPSF